VSDSGHDADLNTERTVLKESRLPATVHPERASATRMAFGRGNNVRDVEKTVFSQSDIQNGRPNTSDNLRDFSWVDTS